MKSIVKIILLIFYINTKLIIIKNVIRFYDYKALSFIVFNHFTAINIQLIVFFYLFMLSL